MSKNNERVLSDAMIADIKEAIYVDLKNDPETVWALIDGLMDSYLTDDYSIFTEIIEDYENEIITELNTQLMEDSFNQTENDN
jgi:hypothetical protein